MIIKNKTTKTTTIIIDINTIIISLIKNNIITIRKEE